MEHRIQGHNIEEAYYPEVASVLTARYAYRYEVGRLFRSTKPECFCRGGRLFSMSSRSRIMVDILACSTFISRTLASSCSTRCSWLYERVVSDDDVATGGNETYSLVGSMLTAGGAAWSCCQTPGAGADGQSHASASKRNGMSKLSPWVAIGGGCEMSVWPRKSSACRLFSSQRATISRPLSAMGWLFGGKGFS